MFINGFCATFALMKGFYMDQHHTPSSTLQGVRRTENIHRAPFQHMGINHCDFHFPATPKLLHRLGQHPQAILGALAVTDKSSLREKSKSLTRRRRHSLRRNPALYISEAISHFSPESFDNTTFTSSYIITTGKYVGLWGRITLPRSTTSRP